MSAAQYRLRIGWAGRNAGVFRFDESLIGSPDVLGFEFTPGYTGTYDNVTAETKAFKMTRGRKDDMSDVTAGTLEVALIDRNGKYAPKNTASVLYPNVKPMRPCLLDASLDGGTTWIELFHGFSNDGETDYDFGAKEATIQFVDLFTWLEASQENIVIASTGPTTVGAAIGLVLDAILWTNPAMRLLDTGSDIPDFTANGEKSGLQIISDLLTADRGLFYIDRRGRARYEDRHARDRRTTWVQVDAARAAIPGFSLSRIKNRARVLRTGGVEQEYLDQASYDEYGPRDFSKIESPYFVDDAAAAYMAKHLVVRSKDPSPPVWKFDTQELAVPIADLLPLDLQDRLYVTIAGVQGHYHVEQLTHEGSEGMLHRVETILSERPSPAGFIFDQSLIGGAETLAA